jgi:hypothetical protein
MRMPKPKRLILILGAALIGGACILETARPSDTSQVVIVTATPDGAGQNPSQESQLSTTPELTETLAAFTPSLTATFTTTPVTMTAGQSLSCVTGPDWKLYEWVAGIPEGETVTLIARAVPEIPDYYVARTAGGKECWVFGGSSTVSGPASTLPTRETPPLPTVNFVVRNRVHIPLTTVYIRSAGGSSWGSNRIAAPLADMSGETSISITAGYYDVRVLDVLGNVMYESYNRAIGADDAYRILTVDHGDGRSLAEALRDRRRRRIDPHRPDARLHPARRALQRAADALHQRRGGRRHPGLLSGHARDRVQLSGDRETPFNIPKRSGGKRS